MKKGTIITLLSIGAVLLVLLVSLVIINNSLVDKEEAVKTAESTITVQLKRRADLLPNFAETATQYSNYEQSTLTAVIEARSAVQKASTPEEVKEKSQNLDSAIDVWVNAVTEEYPDFKSSDLYKGLQDTLEGTENRIAVARKDYNDAVNEYNKAIRRFPNNIVAGIFGFEKAEYFETDTSVNDVPEIF